MKTLYKTRNMKKLLLLLLLFTGIANAQIVNIPDANFKARLIALGIFVSFHSNCGTGFFDI